MVIIDLPNTVTRTASISSQAVTATATGTAVDLQQYRGRVAVTACIGAATAGTNPTLDVKLQESTNNANWSDVSGGTFTQVTTTAALQTLGYDTRGAYRYLRAVATPGGTNSPSFPVSVVVDGQKERV